MKKEKKLKTYVITVSKNFIGKHPKKGTPTGFKEKIKSGEKRHTIRSNYDFWVKRIDKVNDGEAVLSIRQWSGKPYNSKQVEIKKLFAGEVGIQPITTTGNASDIAVREFNNTFIHRFLTESKIKTIAKNDGLSLKDFRDWFEEPLIGGCIIHFTKLRY